MNNSPELIVSDDVSQLMKETLPFHQDSLLLKDIHRQWSEGITLTDKQKRATILELNRLQTKAAQHTAGCNCQRHSIIYVEVLMLTDIRTFTAIDGISYSLLKGDVARLPLLEAVSLVYARHADFLLTTAFDLVKDRGYHHF